MGGYPAKLAVAVLLMATFIFLKHGFPNNWSSLPPHGDKEKEPSEDLESSGKKTFGERGDFGWRDWEYSGKKKMRSLGLREGRSPPAPARNRNKSFETVPVPPPPPVMA